MSDPNDLDACARTGWQPVGNAPQLRRGAQVGHILPEIGVALALVALVLAALLGRAHAAKQCAGDSDCPKGYSCRDATDGHSYCYPDDPPDTPPRKPSGRKQKRICDADRCGGRRLCVPFPALYCDKCCWVDDD